MFFEGFDLTERKIGDVSYRFRSGGSGPAVMLLHGRPGTHAMWHEVAPALAQRFTVICPDLHPERAPLEQVQDLFALADGLGCGSIMLVGQDMGAHLALHMAQFQPERVTRVALLEAVPTADHTGRDDMAYSLAHYESCWFGQLHPKSEAVSVAVPGAWSAPAAGDFGFFHQMAVRDYLEFSPWRGRFVALPAVEFGRISCPVLVLWGARGRIGGWYDPVTVWSGVTLGKTAGHAVDAEQFLAEEAPGEVVAALEGFLAVIPAGVAASGS